MNPNSFRWIAGIFLFIASIYFNISNAQELDLTKWTPTGNLLTARVCHTATLLHDGRVLVVGGYGNSGELASAELYDPKQGIFVRTADMGTGRSNHTATLLANGQVLVVGGQFHESTLSSAELYNPATNTWTATDHLHIARSYHTATLLPNGQVLIAGGAHLASPPVFAQGAPSGSALDIAELYDPVTGKWTVTDNLHTARYMHIATLLENGEVLVAGGIGVAGSTSLLVSAELYNPKSRSWKVAANLPTPLFDHSSILLPNGQVLVIGGKPDLQSDLASAELYNPSTGAWKSTGNALTTISGPCTLLPDGSILAFGGGNNSDAWAMPELYNSTTGTWIAAGRLNTPRCMQTATLLQDNRVLVTGGLFALGSPTNVLASAELYAPGADSASKPGLNKITYCTSSPPNPTTVSSLFTLTICLVIFTGCLVVLTACAVILLCAWLVFALVRRWTK